MGIREKIAKLRPERLMPGSIYYKEEHGAVVDAFLDDVLSILDEWEYVREGKIDFEEFRPEGEDSTFICCLLDDTVLGIILKYSRRVKPGDHIAIYKRREK